MLDLKNQINIKIREDIKKLEIKSYLRNNDDLLKKSAYSRAEIIDCSLGVNPFGYSKYIDREIEKIKWENIYKYPNPSYNRIKEGIRDYWGDTKAIEVGQLHLGFGAMGIMSVLLRLFGEKNIKTLGYAPQFNEFENLVYLVGGKYEYSNLREEKNYKFNLIKVLQSIRSDHGLIYLDNPNNPTGQVVALEDIEKIAKRTYTLKIPLIIDEAYGDFMSKSNSAIQLIDKYPNIMIIRSFSKGFGLANIRLGYLVTSKEISFYYEKANIPLFVFPDIFEDLILSALKDKNFIDKSVTNISINKKKFINEFNRKFNILETSSTVPILTIGVEENIKFREKLLELGIISCDGGDFTGLESNYVRLRIPKEVDQLIERIKLFK